jgi:hypothetical protein
LHDCKAFTQKVDLEMKMSKQDEVTSAANKRCEAMLKGMQAAFPEAGLSFGYIGNLSRTMDDRSWYFFSNIPKKDSDGSLTGDSWALGGYSTANLPQLADWAETELPKRVRRLLDPEFDAKCKINDWYRANEATKEKYPGAIFQKQFGGADGFSAREGVVVQKASESYVALLDGREFPPAANHIAARQQLEEHYGYLPDYKKRMPADADSAPSPSMEP